MARVGRDALRAKALEKLPTNNAKIITANDHREYIDDDIDSEFNWVDDEIQGNDFWYDKNAGITLDDKLNESVPLVQGTVLVGDVRGNPLGALTVTGDINSASKDNSTGQSRIQITFNDLGTTDYMPIFTVRVGTASQSLILNPVLYNVTSNSFFVEMDESGSVVQNNCVLIINIIKFNGY